MTTSPPNAPSGGEETITEAWWRVRPDELAARFDWDADALMDDLSPEDFTDEQAALALDAIGCCRGELPALSVRIDAEVHEALRARIAPDSDTPNGVLRRVLHLHEASPLSPDGPRRAHSCKLLPLDCYDLPLLRVLSENGGSLRTRNALDALGAALAADLTQADWEPLQNGHPRWRDRAQHARLRLIAQGLIANDSPWGVWTITDEGRSALERYGPRDGKPLSLSQLERMRR